MIVLVTGWRDHPDQSEVHRVLEGLFVNRASTMVVVHRAARGADDHAKLWCEAQAVTQIPFPAEVSGTRVCIQAAMLAGFEPQIYPAEVLP